MSNFETPINTPVWVDESKCKACDRCVSVCPAGVLGMRQELSSTLGAMATVTNPESCIGCNDCELSCPDFAIFVADKKDYKFSKLSDEAKERQIEIKNNNYKILEENIKEK